jgi:hypothetical protein
MQRMKLIAATLTLTLFGSAGYADPVMPSPDPYPLALQRDRAETSEAMAHTEAFMWQNRAMQAEHELAQLRAKQAAASGLPDGTPKWFRELHEHNEVVPCSMTNPLQPKC